MAENPGFSQENWGVMEGGGESSKIEKNSWSEVDESFYVHRRARCQHSVPGKDTK